MDASVVGRTNDVARRRLAASLVTVRPALSPDEVVRHHLAMQSQEYLQAKWSVGQRAQGLTERDVEAAVTDGRIIRTHVMRPTWHFVARDDIRWLLELTGARVRQKIARRYVDLGLDPKTLARCEKVITGLLEGGSALRRDQIGHELERNKIDMQGQRLPFTLTHFELARVLCSGPSDGRRNTYALFDERVPAGKARDRDDMLVELTRRYLASHGPATVKDLMWWSGVTASDIKNALELLGDEVERRSVDGLDLWSLNDRSTPPPARGVHLLETFDELVVGYTESRFAGEPHAEQAREGWMGLRGLVVINGAITGHWRHSVPKDTVTVDVVLFEEANPPTMRALKKAADGIGRFFGCPATLETRPA